MFGLERTGRGSDRNDLHLAVFAVPLHEAVGLSEEGVVATHTHVATGTHLRPALADKDGTSRGEFAAVEFNAEALGARIAAVAGSAATFLCCHGSVWLKGVN